jgi:signal transduction histidine kinase
LLGGSWLREEIELSLSANRAGVIGAMLVVLGGAVMLGWFFRIAPIVRALPDFTPMVFGTAACFALCGASLMIACYERVGHRRATTALAAAVIVISALALAEHVLQFDLGIDWPSLHAWLRNSNPNPGRMPAGNAIAFLLAGIVLILGPRASRPWMMITTRALTAVIAVIGALGVLGYAVSAELLFPHYAFSGVAVHTTVGLLLLAIGLRAAWTAYAWAKKPFFERDDDRITFVSATALTVITVVAGVTIFAVVQSRVQTLVRDNLVAALAQRADVFQDVIGMREVNARIAATRPAVHRNLRTIRGGVDDGSNIANINAVVKSFLEQGFSGVAYYDVDGKLVAGGGGFAQSPSLSVSLATPGNGKLLWQDGFILQHRLPMYDAAGKVGEVQAEQPLPVLTRLMNEAGDGREMGVCQRRGRENLCFPERLNPRAFSTAAVNLDGNPLPMSRALEGETGTLITRDYRKQNVVAAFAPMGKLGLGMVLKVNAAEVFQPIREELQVAIGLLLLLVAAGTLLLRAQVRPLATRLIAASEALKTLNEQLEQRVRERTAGLARAQSMAKLAHVITGPDGAFLSWSDTLADLAGVEHAMLPRTTRDWLKIVHPDDRALFREKAIEAGRVYSRTELAYRLQRPDGASIHVVQTMEPLGGEPGPEGGSRWFNTLQDVSEQKRAQDEIRQLNDQLEKRVAQRTAELGAVNRELEAFSYSISHDLRAPLRHIHGFADLLKDDGDSRLSESGSRYLGIISDAVKQMGALIDDLLEFSRMGRRELRFAEVSMDHLLREVLTEMGRVEADRKVDLQIDPLPQVHGDRAMLKQVWVNLLSNAWKYTRKRDRACIRVGCTPKGGELEFYVEDNGAGFDMKYADKLFGVFQRLHRAEEFEGTGVGLANVHRIVTRHGGRTYAQGRIDQGATFYFTLPPVSMERP